MRTETRTVQIGERVGDVDWSYDFRSHFGNHGPDVADKRCKEAKDRLRAIEAAFRAGEPVEATTDGGWPRCGWGVVLDVGMYDGWPYWKPVPSVYTRGPLGGEWHSFVSLSDFAIRSLIPPQEK